MKNEIKPNFLVIGAQRAGTTWLYECLREHPDIYLPEQKELHYFDLNLAKGEQWYLSHFANANETAIGEITPNYYQYPGAIEEALVLLPSAKLIFILREPKERALSQFSLFKEKWGVSTVEQAIMERPEFADLSLQGKHLKRIISIVPRERLLILFYDDLASKPLEFLSSIYRFLNVKETEAPLFLNKTVNKVLFPNIQLTLRKVGMGTLLDVVKNSRFAEPVKNILSIVAAETKTKPSLPDSFEKELHEDTKYIEAALDIDLKHWR